MVKMVKLDIVKKNNQYSILKMNLFVVTSYIYIYALIDLILSKWISVIMVFIVKKYYISTLGEYTIIKEYIYHMV